MAKLNILIITYYWPPSGGAGVQRWLKFVKYLPKHNWNPVIFTVKNGEYPVKPGIPWDDLQNSWGSFKEDSLGLSVIADNRALAVRLVDEVGYNN